jgi:AbrB family looped-hinge helix DNA binding protein
MESALTAKGQTTIPKAIREHLHLQSGDRIKFFIHQEGTVVLLPKVPVSALKGIISAHRRPASVAPSIEEMDEVIAAGATTVVPSGPKRRA